MEATSKPSKLSKWIGFEMDEMKSWNRFVSLLHKPVDPSSLAVARILFGLLMAIDIPDERGMGDADLRWGDADECRFPLFDFIQPLPLEWMCLVYFTMWIGALGVMFGAFYKLSCAAFTLPYWYIFLLDKSKWNNHSYLYGLLGLLFSFSKAHHFWSIDVWWGRVRSDNVPIWNYGVLRFQLFILYFYAGLKKMDLDWISGQSMPNLSHHWVFEPMRYFLDTHQIDLWIVHVFGFLLDLTVGFWIYFDSTRPIAFVFLSSFHLINSQLFTIGMFPYVCLATMPLFCRFDWPKQILSSTLEHNVKTGKDPSQTKTSKKLNKNRTAVLLCLYAALQLFLPYSHFITKGYNNWTNGLYGYSWDMMVHSWDTVLIMIKVVNNDNGEEMFLDENAWVQTDKWHRHADMAVQYSRCLKRNILAQSQLKNISIYFDVWTSLNRRFQQRIFDPRVDFTSAVWSPFATVSWVMPLLTEFSNWRQTMAAIRESVRVKSNQSDTLFIADFPGLYLDNYIHKDLVNVSLTVLSGEIIVEIRDKPNRSLTIGQSFEVPPAAFHRVHTVSQQPSCYLYTYLNATETQPKLNKQKPLNYFFKYFYRRINGVVRSVALVSNSILKILYSVPMTRRVRLSSYE